MWFIQIWFPLRQNNQLTWVQHFEEQWKKWQIKSVLLVPYILLNLTVVEKNWGCGMHRSFPLTGTRQQCIGLKMKALWVFLRQKSLECSLEKTFELCFPWWFHLPLETAYNTYHQWPIIQTKLVSSSTLIK